MKTMKSGFTLIEMSIVLVVIGLIVGGIIMGQDLIKAAQRRAILSEIEHYKTAVNTFRNKYNSIPGDMTDATNYWGNVAGNDCPGSGTIASPATCNGNGDGQICGGNQYWTATCNTEALWFWKHLANANLINGNYSGASNGYLEIPGQSVPQSTALSNIAYATLYLCLSGAGPTGGNYFDNGFCGNVIVAGAPNPTPGSNWLSLSAYAAISTLDAQWIDSKVDDGKPGTGSVMTFPNGSAYLLNCATTANPQTASYNLAFAGPQCSLIFAGQF